MNERIRELADKAGRFRSHNGGINGGPNPALLYGDENIQKFAELLIRECLVQIDDAIPETNCSAAGAYQTAKLAATNRVKKHFGVE